MMIWAQPNRMIATNHYDVWAAVWETALICIPMAIMYFIGRYHGKLAEREKASGDKDPPT